MPIKADIGHVVMAVDRYDNHRVTEDPTAVQGSNRSRAETRKELVSKINTESYEVNAPAVAEAILERLLAGTAVRKQRQD